MQLTRTQKRKLAQELYLNTDKTLKEIAELVGISVQTLTKWKKDGNWDTLKDAWSTTIERELPRLLNQLKQFNDYIESKPEGFGSSKEYDALNKLKSIIKAFDNRSLSTEIQVLKNFIGWLKDFDLDKAKEIADLADQYIKELTTKYIPQ